MSLKTTLVAAAMATILPGIASANMIIEDAYARSSTQAAGAAFMAIINHSDTDDRVVSISSDAADRVEMHTHIEDENGVMRMREVEGGFMIPAGETHMLMRGGNHVMFMGLAEAWDNGDEVTVTFTFEHADPVTVTIPVDLDRMPGQHGMSSGEATHDGHAH